MTTIKDIAKAANVSVATVSRVVNDGPKVGKETREKVKQVMAAMGYKPNANARALVNKQDTAIGVIIPQVADPFFAALADGIDLVAKEQNRQLLINTCGETAEGERNALRLLQERRCQAIVMHSKKIPDDELVTYMQQLPSLILINRHLSGFSERCVWLDNYAGGKQAAQHLHVLGHSAIVMLNSDFDIDDPKQRQQGFSDTLSTLGVEFNQDSIAFAHPDHIGGQQAMTKLLSQGKPFTAVFVYNDAMALGAISKLEDAGIKVPEQVSVLGFDDIQLAQFFRPKLSTLRYPIAAMATQAATMALNNSRQAKSDLQSSTELPLSINLEATQTSYTPKLISRQSTISI